MGNTAENTYKGYTFTERMERMKYIEVCKEGNYVFKAADIPSAQKMIDIIENIPKPNNRKRRPQPKNNEQKHTESKSSN